ncbi:MAG: D-sedoheptulose 7-phosphate isomerase [Hyphomicrobiales bacterium]|nr:D-sedoheptulose 7-phosphate isomerase [Hyphomicrobiales bacterium]
MATPIEFSLSEHLATIEVVRDQLQPDIAEVAGQLSAVLKSGGKLLVCGNGGSAADAQHFAAELVGRFEKERNGLPAIALTTDSSSLTAIGNDYGFERVFSRQVEALASAADALIGISTSGQSGNVLLAMKSAKDRGCKVIGITGRDGGCIAEVADLSINVPVQRTARIQEAHLTILHILCELIEIEVIAKGV